MAAEQELAKSFMLVKDSMMKEIEKLPIAFILRVEELLEESPNSIIYVCTYEAPNDTKGRIRISKSQIGIFGPKEYVAVPEIKVGQLLLYIATNFTYNFDNPSNPVVPTPDAHNIHGGVAFPFTSNANRRDIQFDAYATQLKTQNQMKTTLKTMGAVNTNHNGVIGNIPQGLGLAPLGSMAPDTGAAKMVGDRLTTVGRELRRQVRSGRVPPGAEEFEGISIADFRDLTGQTIDINTPENFTVKGSNFINSIGDQAEMAGPQFGQKVANVLTPVFAGINDRGIKLQLIEMIAIPVTAKVPPLGIPLNKIKNDILDEPNIDNSKGIKNIQATFDNLDGSFTEATAPVAEAIESVRDNRVFEPGIINDVIGGIT